MKFFFMFFIILGCAILTTAQKPCIDHLAYATWPSIDGERISNNGKYILYIISSGGVGGVLYIQSTDNSWKKEIRHINNAIFTGDSRRVIFMAPGDSLGIIDLESNAESYVPHAQSFKIPPSDTGQWLAYHLTTNELVIYNLHSKEKHVYKHVDDYFFSNSGKVLLLQREIIENKNKSKIVEWLDLKSGKASLIWHGIQAGNFVFDHAEMQLAFLTEDDHGEKGNKIWYFRSEMDSAQVWIDDNHLDRGSGFHVARSEMKFSPNGKKLFFEVVHALSEEVRNRRPPNVHIYSYQDELIDFNDANEQKSGIMHSYLAVVHAGEKKGVRLEQETDGTADGIILSEGGDVNYALTETTNINVAMGYRSPKGRPEIYLINLKDGTRKRIGKRLWDGELPQFSPGGKYVLWYDRKKYFTYNIQTGITTDISSRLPVAIYEEVWDVATSPYSYQPVAWLSDGESILIYDRYDIWKVDLSGKSTPLNVTNGYGRKNKIILRWIDKQGRYFTNGPVIRNDEKIYLCGFSEIDKSNGFLYKQLGTIGDPVKLIMSPEVFYFPDNQVGLTTFLLKAKDTEKYVLKRMSAVSYPNLQITTDFRSFKPATDLQPQRAYNWLTSELVHWKTFDGRLGEGILYKPENFDFNKKYPVIFYFYERLSTGLNKYIKPELSVGPINIPYFVSRGYLVFCPDIHYKVGEPGNGIYNYVVSAAKMMSEKTWVDGKRMGIQGHSWGGYEVNYLITKTGLFAAAVAAAGVSDLVSNALCDNGIGGTGPAYTEQACYRMGTTIWQNPSFYIKNSPVFGADKVITPLLIMHNKKDGNVPWSQGIEMFTALRRLDKRVWMLQYDNGAHTVYDDDALDYSSRIEQFFDHYLKGVPAPKWMQTGTKSDDDVLGDDFEGEMLNNDR